MHRKKYIFFVFCFAAMGIVVSLIIFPSRKEEALMYFYDKRYDEAYERFSEIYHKENDRSISAALPLAWLHLHFANVGSAIEVLEDYVAKNPGDIDAKEYLGDLYRDANRPYEYLMNLDEIYRLKPSGSILRKQERIFTHLGDVKGKQTALEGLVDHGEATQSEYCDLAYLYMSEGRKEEALALVESLIAKFPLHVLSSQTLNFVVFLYLNTGESAKAETLAKRYVEKTQNVDDALLMINLFLKSKLYHEGLSLLDLLPLRDQNLPTVVLVRASLLLGAGDKELAYQYLQEQFVKGNLPQKMQGTLLSLGLYYEKKPEILFDIVEKIDLGRVPQGELLHLAKVIIDRHYTNLAFIVKNKLGTEYLQNNPIIAIALDMGETEPSEEEKNHLAELHKTRVFDDKDKATLASLYHKKGYDDLAKSLLSSVGSLDTIEQQDLYGVSSLYVNLDIANEGLELVNELRQENPPKETDVDESWLLLSTATGRLEEVKEFLEQDDTVALDYFVDLFYLAHERNEDAFALEIARELYDADPSPQNASLLAIALVSNGEIDEGMALFDVLHKQGLKVSSYYIQALAAAAKKDDKYRNTLKETLLTLLADKKLSETKQREYGYYLLDNDFKREAAKVFFPLAKGKDFNNGDVQNLLASWDEKVTQEQADWVAERAFETEGKEKGDWLSFLVYRGHPAMAVGLITDADLDEEAIADVYLEAAGALEDKGLIADAVTKIYPKERRLPRLNELGELTRGYGLFTLAKKIYEKILGEDPNSYQALKALGMMAYSEGSLTCARVYFERLLQYCHCADYQVYFYYGDILWQKNRQDPAKNCFYQSLHKALCIEAKDEKDFQSKQKEAMLIMARIYQRLNRIRYAIGVFNALLRSHPNDAALRVDFANFMMDVEGFLSAACLLGWQQLHIDKKNEETERNRKLAWVRYLKETAKLKAAIAQARKLIHEYPDEHQVYAAAADVYFVTGQWRRALCNINQAINKQPQNEFYHKARRDIVWDHLPFWYTDFEYRKTGIDQKEHFYRVYLRTLLQNYTTAEMRWERDHVNLADFTRVDGVTGPFHGFRERGEISIWHDFIDGRKIKGSFFFGESVLGGAYEWSKACYNDIYSYTLQWHKPSWEDIQSTIEYGSKDRFIVSRYHRFNRLWDGKVTGSYNRYNLRSFPSAAVTWELEALVTYRFPQQQCIVRCLGGDAQINLNYFLDKEQIVRLKKNRDAEGVKFAPLPIRSRESHNWYAFMSKRFFEGFAVEAYFGYTWDRETKKSMLPIGGCSVILLRREDFQMTFNYNHTASTEDTEQLVDSWLFSLKYVY